MKIGISVGETTLTHMDKNIKDCSSDKKLINVVNNMVKEDTNSISNFNINFNFYDFIKENIKQFRKRKPKQRKILMVFILIAMFYIIIILKKSMMIFKMSLESVKRKWRGNIYG